MTTTTVVTALLMVVGLLGIVVPFLPGLLIVAAAPALWAVQHTDGRAWIVVAVGAVAYLTGVVTQYLIPGRRMRAVGVRTSTLLLAVVTGIVGFFVVPIVGGVVGFVLGIYVIEFLRQHDTTRAWVSTKAALRAVLQSVGIELLAGFAIVLVWVGGLLALGQGG